MALTKERRRSQAQWVASDAEIIQSHGPGVHAQFNEDDEETQEFAYQDKGLRSVAYAVVKIDKADTQLKWKIRS